MPRDPSSFLLQIAMAFVSISDGLKPNNCFAVSLAWWVWTMKMSSRPDPICGAFTPGGSGGGGGGPVTGRTLPPA